MTRLSEDTGADTDSGGCACCGPAAEPEPLVIASPTRGGEQCGPECVRAGECVCTTPEASGQRPLAMSEIDAECLLPVIERPGREAEFDALFHAAGRNWSRPAANRIILDLDSGYESWARDLAEREQACCSFFTFEFVPGSDGALRLEVSVPASHTVAVDALTDRAAASAEASA